MKCPKCSYLGFETGDRCKNCGYDFSLALEPAAAGAGLSAGPGRELDLSMVALTEADLSGVAFPNAQTLAPAADLPLHQPVPAAARSPQAAVPRAGVSSLPLFHPAPDQDDEPLIKLPAAPRPPLAVRRTPDRPRPRAVPKAARRVADAPASVIPEPPALQFLDEPAPQISIASGSALPAAVAPPPIETSGTARRLIAAAIDQGILLAVDVGVVYFTLKMATLNMDDWRMLSPIPLAAFLMMLKVAYFCAFTLVGGQTIGKMAVGIRVVGDDGAGLDPARAIQRTLTGALSLLPAGLGFLPVLLADDRRGVHDRVARTRVIALPSGSK